MSANTFEREIVDLDSGRDRQTILEQMERILASPPFRNSKRYPVLLRYVIEKTLRGEGETLKERTVGVDAFRRHPDYDTNADPIVRVTAGEVRKRIAQYYHEDGRDDELRIDLTPGTYIPIFSLRKDMSQDRPKVSVDGAAAHLDIASETVSAPDITAQSVAKYSAKKRISLKRGGLAAGTSILILAVASIVWLYYRETSSPFVGAWKPFLSTGVPVLVNIGQPSLARSPETTPELPFGSVREHLFNANGLVFSDVQALVQIVAMLDRQNVPHRLQPAGATTFADMRQGPVILIGGLDNPWTMRVLSTKRFQFLRLDTGISCIKDREDPANHRWSVDFSRPYQELTADYAIVARFMEPDTGQPVMVVAGVGENGTKAASEFITDPSASRTFFQSGQNVELVLGTTVLKGVSGPPRILAKVTW